MKQNMLYGIIGLLIGVVSTIFVVSTANNNNNTSAMGMHVRNHEMGMNSSMDDMTTSLQRSTGDNFDKSFISSMIIHHQGAIAMANEAKTSAKHDEIKSLANDIIKAQTKEIEQMKQWQKKWGYQ